MHICFLTSEFPKKGFPHGGVGTFIRNLSVELVKNDIQVSVVGPNYSDIQEEEDFFGVNVYRTRTYDKFKGLVWWKRAKNVNQRLKEIHQKNPIDIIEATELGLAFINKIPGIQYVIRMNGGHHFFAKATDQKTSFWRSFQEKRSFKKADHLISVSKFTAESTRELLKLGQRKIEIIPNPIDTDLFSPIPGVAVKHNKLLFVGTICEKKGIRQLVMAMPSILKKFPDASLEVVGRDWYDPINKTSYTTYLRKFIAPEAENHIHITGVVDLVEIPKKIAEAEICVYPSHMEALPLAWLEVLSMGKPFVGSTSGPGPEVVNHGQTGLLANCYSPEDIAEKVIGLLSDKQHAKEMGLKAREDVLVRFDVKVLIEKNLQYFNSILE
jgi:glycosyltransferase involved in cell wall biosynthesis